jgi:hypothetical protein
VFRTYLQSPLYLEKGLRPFDAERRRGSDSGLCTPVVQMARWSRLGRMDYRQALRTGRFHAGLAAEEPLLLNRATVVFIHSSNGTPGQFGCFADAVRGRANVVAFVYDDRSRLEPVATVLRDCIASLLPRVVVVAHSLGALLLAFLGAMDSQRRLRDVGAVYLNPLIGGSRYADADRALAVLGELPGL